MQKSAIEENAKSFIGESYQSFIHGTCQHRMEEMLPLLEKKD